eukprot:CAMPEP_0198666434 /NCGR_PEP_ID=MMETSP1467-20131203/64621_1 /TAXON_ID=1462469 /ORGANISM="unid. sp., Strain CCMP2135" /LENGTH=87 /DNA_ID=CAMNT_0044403081 /DNA_START=18 /DNA_END=278 /DNA_ORIENTATION=-
MASGERILLIVKILHVLLCAALLIYNAAIAPPPPQEDKFRLVGPPMSRKSFLAPPKASSASRASVVADAFFLSQSKATSLPPSLPPS